MAEVVTCCPDGARSWDAVVVGLGPAGAVHAARLAEHGRRVLAVAPQRARPAGTFELLSARCADPLHELELLDPIRRRAPACDGTAFRWHEPTFGLRRGAGWTGGWIVDRAWLDPLLRAWVAGRGVDVCDATAVAVHGARGAWRVTVRHADGHRTTVEAEHVVLATGRAARLPSRSGVVCRPGLPMVAITTATAGPLPELGARLLVDAADNGWWYAVGDGLHATVGFVTDVDLLATGSDRFAATWRRAADSAPWLPDWARTAPLRGRACTVHDAPDAPAGPSVIGDAALALDPLSGHGITLAVLGALRAADDPDAHAQWLRDEQLAHERDGQALYTAAAREGAFWARRDGRLVRT